MKSRFLRTGISATAITFIWAIVNYILGHAYGKIIGITGWGGEVSYTYGFGIVLKKTWPLSSVENPIKSTTTVIVSPVIFLLTVIGLWIILYTVFWLIDKIKGKKVQVDNT